MPRWNNPNCGFQKGQRLTEETKKKISKALRGNKNFLGKTPWNKGKYLSEAIRRKMSESHKGKPSGMLNKRHSEKTREKISKKNKGKHCYWIEKKLSYEHKNKISLSNKGEKSYLWKGGITPKINQRCNSLWWKKLRKFIYQRDNWICQMCLKKCHNNIQCHHIIPERLGGTHKLENLITLCKSCHIKIDLLKPQF